MVVFYFYFLADAFSLIKKRGRETRKRSKRNKRRIMNTERIIISESKTDGHIDIIRIKLERLDNRERDISPEIKMNEK